MKESNFLGQFDFGLFGARSLHEVQEENQAEVKIGPFFSFDLFDSLQRYQLTVKVLKVLVDI